MDKIATTTAPPLPGMEASLNEYEEAQLKSEMARAIFEAKEGDAAPWMDDYFDLIARGWGWRQAVYILWASQPAGQRTPKTQGELATHILGLTSDRAIREWRNKNPAIDAEINHLTISVLAKKRAAVLATLAEMAAEPDYKNFNYTRVFLEMTGDYVPKQATVNMNANMTSDDMKAMSTDELRDFIRSQKVLDHDEATAQ